MTKSKAQIQKNLNLKILYHKIKPEIVAKKKGKEINYGEKIEKLTFAADGQQTTNGNGCFSHI